MSGDTTTPYNPNAGFTPDFDNGGIGNYWWEATYTSGNGDDASTTSCGTGIPYTNVTAPIPTLTLIVPPTDKTGVNIKAGTIGAILANASEFAYGTITFDYYGPSSTAKCTTGGKQAGTATLNSPSGDGTYYATGPGFTPNTAGTYWWQATFTPGFLDPDSQVTTTCGASGTDTVVNVNAPTLTLTSGTGGIPATEATSNYTLPAADVNALLTGASTSASGSITFYGSGPTSDTTCPDPMPTTDIVGTASSGVSGTDQPTPGQTYTSSSNFPYTGPGIYWFYAVLHARRR